MKSDKKYFLVGFIILTFLSCNQKAFSFGFYAHRTINRMAIFALPPDMFSFYKKHVEYITEHAIDPDKRSRGIEGEDKKHYIDIEYFGEHPFDSIPIYWNDAIAKFTEDTLQKYGINPWWINKMVYSLTQAFKDENFDNILYISANIGHYIADNCTPLHTTKWYDGKVAEQKGIHAFWETRIPELEAVHYNFMLGRAEYVDKVPDYIWQITRESNAAIDTILEINDSLMINFPDDKKYVYDEKGSVMKNLFSKEYVSEFDVLVHNMVEKRMQRAVIAVASLWFTAWVNSGQPDLSRLENKEISKELKKEQEETEKMWKTGKPIGRPNPE
ncbi:MAG: zinc dependent phospholipase C family protein [Bacteroidota bacterium]